MTTVKFWGILPLHGSHFYHNPLSIPPVIIPVEVFSTAFLEKKQKTNWSPYLPSILPAATKFSIPMPGFQSIVPLLKGVQKVLNAKIRSRHLSLTFRVL